MDGFIVRIDDPMSADVQALLGEHLAFVEEDSPPEDVHALDITGLLAGNVTFFSIREAGELLGIGALQQLDEFHAEVKSMHTAEAARGLGVGRTMLDHLVDVSKARGCRRVSLETGSMPAFAPARSLYTSAGFETCGPFAGYVASPNSVFMTLERDRHSLPEDASSPWQMVKQVPAPGEPSRPWLPEPLVTRRLVLRPTVPADEMALILLYTDHEVRRHLGGALSDDQARARILITSERWGHFTITNRVSEQFIGTLSFSRKRGAWELLYQLRRAAWGQGLGGEAVASSLDWFFSSTGESDILAVTQLHNRRSRRLLERLGAEAVDRFEEHGAQQETYRLTRSLRAHADGA